MGFPNTRIAASTLKQRLGLLPFVGYHHLMMIGLATAMILFCESPSSTILCKFPIWWKDLISGGRQGVKSGTDLNCKLIRYYTHQLDSFGTLGLHFLYNNTTRPLSHLPFLPASPPLNVCSTGQSKYNDHVRSARQRIHTRSTCRLFWALCAIRRRDLDMQQQFHWTRQTV